MILHLRAAVQQLYAAGLGDFTSARSAIVAEAKKAGETALAKQVGGLRKPTVAAWALNHFVREYPDELETFHDFAELLREAQRTLDADQLRVLSRERSRRVDALARKVESASRTAGQPISDSVGQEIRQTLTAFIADEAAEESVMTGALVKPLQYSGFGDVDIEGVAAVAPRHLRAIPGGAGEEAEQAEQVENDEDESARAAEEERRRAALAAERRRLEQALARASKAREDADHKVEVQQARVAEAREGVADLERQLATARDRLGKVTGELGEVSGIRDERARDEEKARRALDEHSRE